MQGRYQPDPVQQWRNREADHADTNISHNAAAALAHTVNLADANLVTVVHCKLAENFAGKQCALPTDADDNNVKHIINPP